MIKCTALFQLSTNKTGDSAGGPRLAGWSESWWSSFAIGQTRLHFENLCGARAGLLPGGAVIVGQRYQIEDGGSSTAGKRFPGVTAHSCDIPQAALLCRAVVGDKSNIRAFTLRGIPDRWVVEGELFKDASFNPRWTTFKNTLEGGPFGFKGRDLAAETVGVARVEAGALTLQADLVFNVGDFIQLRDVRDQFRRSVSGRYQVTAAPDSQHATLRGWPAGSIVDLNGKASVYTTVVAMNNMEVDYVRIVSRKVGRPFESYVGRGSRRR